jgi:hypothetical protein
MLMEKTILIYKNNFTDKFIKYKPIMYNGKIFELYDGHIINPPFFDFIIIEHNELTIDELKMIYNMTKTKGTILFLSKYNNFFKNGVKVNAEFYKKVKDNNDIYIFNNKYRTIEFIIMGTQKGGTTALANNISHHPDIYIDPNPDPFKSEIHFFDIYFQRGIEWYKKHFNYNKKVVGEKTPDLMYLSYTFPYIQSINPYLKIILILRNPIERAISAWKLNKKYFNETRTFEDAVNTELNYESNQNVTFYTAVTQYLQRGLYYKQIQEILKWFSKDNLLILFNDEVKENMEREYNRVYKFLNLKPFKYNYKIVFESDNDNINLDKKLLNKLKKYFKKDIQQLEKFVNKKLDWL